MLVSEGGWSKIESYLNGSEFAKHLGVEVSLSDPKQPKCEVREIKPFHLGGAGKDHVNGPIMSAIFDLVIGLTALEYFPLGGVATSNINIRLLKPVEKNRFYAIANCRRKVGKRIFSDSTLFNYRGEACGYATGETIVGIR